MTDPTARASRLDTRAVLSLLLCCSLWGLNQTLTKLTLAEVPPLLQAGLRSLGAAVLLAAWSARRGIGLWPAPGARWPGLAAGLLFGIEFGCVFVGLQHTSASRMAVLLYLAPFVVALGMPFITRGERLGPLQWGGLLVAFGGVAWAIAGGGAPAGAAAPASTVAGATATAAAAATAAATVAAATAWGDALALAAALLWGATTLLVRATPLAAAPPEQTLFAQVAVSGVLLVAASAVAGEAWPAPAALSAQAWALLGFQAGVVTFASYLLWFWLVRHYPATQVSAFTMLTPIVGLWAGVALLDEPLSARLVGACAAVVTGLALVNRPRR